MYKYSYKLFLIFFYSIMLSACSREAEQTASKDSRLTGTLLVYEQLEPGLDPFLNRVIVTSEFLRMDDGTVSSDYVLFDRTTKSIYSVSHSNQTVLVLEAKPMPGEMPIPLTLDAHKSIDPEAPRIEGIEVVQYELIVNQQVCSHVLVAPGLLSDAVEAMRGFHRVLAGQHAENLPKTPVEMLDPCFVAHHVLAPGRSHQWGLPIKEWDETGIHRTLVQYEKDFPLQPGLFEIPSQYQEQRMDGEKGSV